MGIISWASNGNHKCYITTFSGIINGFNMNGTKEIDEELHFYTFSCKIVENASFKICSLILSVVECAV